MSEYLRKRMGDKAWGKGCKHVPRVVPCTGKGCKASLIRRVHFADAKCEKCRRADSARRQAGKYRKLLEEARRYRLLCHILGWEPEQWKEMLEDVKECPNAYRTKPESRAARYDLTYSRKYMRRCE